MRGPYIDGSAVLVGGLVGAVLGKRIPERIRTALPLMFGLCSMGMGIVLIGQVKHLAAMVLAVILGAIIGELIYLENAVGRFSEQVRLLAERFMPRTPEAGESEAAYLQTFVAILVLFCASGTGIFGAMKEGMTGDSSVLIAKAFLDLFTALIFATTLGYAVAVISIPQLVIQLALAYGAVFIMPLTNPMLIADFSAVGGVIMFATGLRICGIKNFSVANMLPGLLLAMPLSALWARMF